MCTNGLDALAYPFGVFFNPKGEITMSQQTDLKIPDGQQMVPELIKEIEKLKHEAVMSKDFNKYLDNKLDKVLGDRIVLRNENYKLQRQLKLKEQLSNKNGHASASEEEECVSCSA